VHPTPQRGERSGRFSHPDALDRHLAAHGGADDAQSVGARAINPCCISEADQINSNDTEVCKILLTWSILSSYQHNTYIHLWSVVSVSSSTLEHRVQYTAEQSPEGRPLMHRTLEAIVDEPGNIRLLETVPLPTGRHVLVTIRGAPLTYRRGDPPQ
jgi:hypothetical protein